MENMGCQVEDQKKSLKKYKESQEASEDKCSLLKKELNDLKYALSVQELKSKNDSINDLKEYYIKSDLHKDKLLEEANLRIEELNKKLNKFEEKQLITFLNYIKK